MRKLILGIIVFIIGALGVVLYNPSRVNEPVLTATPEGTAGPTTSSIHSMPPPSGWQMYDNKDLGIRFSYPRKWGEPETTILTHEDNPEGVWSGREIAITFPNESIHGEAVSSDFTGYGAGSYTGELNLQQECGKPLEIREGDFGPAILSTGSIEGTGYCRLFEQHGRYLYHLTRIGGLPEGGENLLTQHAMVNLDHPVYKGLEFQQFFTRDVHFEYGDDFPAYLRAIQSRTAPPAILEKIDEFERMILSLEISR